MATEPTSGGVLRRHRAAALVAAAIVALFGLTAAYAAFAAFAHPSSARIVFGNPPPAQSLAAYARSQPTVGVAVGAAQRLERDIPSQAALVSAAAEVRRSVTVSADAQRAALVVNGRDNRLAAAGRTARAYAESLKGSLGPAAVRDRASVEVQDTSSGPLAAIAIAVAILGVLTVALLLARRAKP
jgi:hypothetical protein